MKRSRKTSATEGLVELLALMPWWCSVLLAGLSYLLLHRIAAQELVPQVPGQMGATVVQAFWKGLATVGQYLLPFACLVAAGVSAWRRHERRRLAMELTASDAAGALDAMTWRDFELLVGEGFRMQGYRVAENGGGGADGGVDLVLFKDGERFFVQCKQWKAFKVGVEVVRELYGVMAAGGAAGGFVVTSGRFTEEAERFASGRNVRLVDGRALHALIRSARVSGGTPDAESPREAAAPAVSPACPACGSEMVRRLAKRGANAGSGFWGCSHYPRCKATRAIG